MGARVSKRTSVQQGVREKGLTTEYRRTRRRRPRYARATVGGAHLRENDDTPADVKCQVNELYARIGLADREL